MKTFLRCRRKWWLSEYRGLAPKGSDPTGPLRSGSRVHTGLEAFYTPGADAMQALIAAQAEDWTSYAEACGNLDLEPDLGVINQFAKDCELERVMLEGYSEWVAESGVDAGLEFIDTEQVISVSGDSVFPALAAFYGLPFEIVGKMDARVRRGSDGKRLFMDHKTAASLVKALAGLQSDPQMLHYHWLERQTEDTKQCDGALYNMLKKVKRTKAATPPFYDRQTILHNDIEIQSYEMRMRFIIAGIFQLENALKDAETEGYAAQLAYPTRTLDCDWDCPYREVCPLFDDGSRAEAMLADQFVHRDPLARYGDPGTA